MRQILNGLLHLHSNGICHRALKPGNIFISHRNEPTSLVKVANFGFTRIFHEKEKQNTTLLWKRLTKSGTSASWLAPETYNEEEFTDRMDMFPVGLLFGFILTGGRRHVFDGGSKGDRITRMRTSQPMTLTLEHLGNEPDATPAFNLIVGLVTPESCDRPTSAMILEHPIFSKDAKKRSSSQASASDSVQGNRDTWFTFIFIKSPN